MIRKAPVEDAVIVLCLVLFGTHLFVPGLTQDSVTSLSGSAERLPGIIITSALWLTCGVLMLRHAKTMMSHIKYLTYALPILSVATASFVWSEEPSMSFRKAILLLLTTLFGLYLASTRSVRSQLSLITAAAGILALSSIALALFWPHLGLDHEMHTGVWKGVFTQKNVAARSMVFFLVCVIGFKPSTLGGKAVKWVTIISSTVLIAMTGSRTGLALYGCICLLFVAVSVSLRLDSKLRLLLCMGAAGAFAAVFLSSLPLYTWRLLSGGDMTLTGRTNIWVAVLQSIGKHPWIGYGYDAFWSGMRGESANVILAARWAVPSAHNGFLEVWLQLGILGLAAFLLFVGRGLVISLGAASRRQLAPVTFALVTFALTIAYNLDESGVLPPNDWLWIVVILASVNMEKAVSTLKCQRPNRAPQSLVLAETLGL
jgi:exopolysaccharide production protein ExoQ